MSQGTRQFASHRVLQGLSSGAPVEHRKTDDIESFFWVAIWAFSHIHSLAFPSGNHLDCAKFGEKREDFPYSSGFNSQAALVEFLPGGTDFVMTPVNLCNASKEVDKKRDDATTKQLDNAYEADVTLLASLGIAAENRLDTLIKTDEFETIMLQYR